MNIILNSGYVISNVEPTDNTKSIIGLWRWSKKQNIDQVLSFKNVNISSNQIAAIIGEEDIQELTEDDFPKGFYHKGGYQ